MPDRDYTVFTCDPGDERASIEKMEQLWVPRPPVRARTEKAAIDAVRDRDPDLKGNADVLYFAVAGFRPRKMIREIIEKFSLGYADEDTPAPDRQQTIDDALDAAEAKP